MRLGIDAREIQEGVYTGIGRPLANFLEYFDSLTNDDTCILFSNKKIPLSFGPKITNVIIPEIWTFYWDQWQLPHALKENKIDLFYSPYYKIPLLKPCLSVSAILDLMYLSYKPYYDQMPIFKKIYYASMGKAFALRADKILTCSGYSKLDIQRVYGISEDKIAIIHLSLHENYKPQPGYSNIDGEYILYVGNFKKHKNVKGILDAFELIIKDFPHLKLVLVGPKEYEYESLCKAIAQKAFNDQVIFLGKITDSKQLNFLYSDAKVFVMPSLYEGFGLPPLEAMASGVPVVASKTTSIPEVVNDAGLLIDPNNPIAIADAIKAILLNDDLRTQLIARGLNNAKEFEAAKISAYRYEFFKGLVHRA